MPRKVLVADDSVTIQKVVGITFASEDVALSFVDNGEEAIDVARQIKPDLIIADVLMPRKSGYEVCEAIKHDPELSHIPVLLLTGTFEPFDAEQSRRVGADGTITKPFESQALIRQVNDLLDRAAARAQSPVDVVSHAPAMPAAPAAQAVPAQAPASEEAESAFADLSRDLELEALPGAAESDAQAAAPPTADPVPEADAVEDFDLDFESSGDSLMVEDAERSPEAAPADSRTASPRLSEREDEFEFVEDPGEVLELGEPVPVAHPEQRPVPIERPFGASDPPGADLFAQAHATESGEVWDLSDLEAVEESAVIEAEEPQEETESPTFWDDAAAEAIDLVESVSVDAPEELLLSEDEALDTETPAAELAVMETEPGRLTENADLDLPLTGADEDAAPSARAAQPVDETTLHPSLENLPEFDFDATAAGEPHEEVPEIESPAEPLSPVPFLVDPFYAESLEADPPAPTPGSPETAGAPTTVAAVADLGAEAVNDVVRRAVNDAVERVTWEAFSDLSETVVKAVKEKVEQIAWEVIPQMAEAMIREEIKRISEEKK